MSQPTKPDAAERLQLLLEQAAARLDTLGHETWLIAEAPHKFNDANHDDYWYAVQLGASYWEQSQFF